MNSYLLSWNPSPEKGWVWENIADCAKKTASGKLVNETWSCANQTVRPGERVFLAMVGRDDRGIVGAGKATSQPKVGVHWNKTKAAAGETYHYIECDWDRILNPDLDTPLPLETIRKNRILAKFGRNWTPRISGIKIPKEIAAQLEQVWAEHIQFFRAELWDNNDEISSEEGGQKWVMVRHRRREQKLRDAKIRDAIHRGNGALKCEVPNCGFVFFDVYGKIGFEFAHVHHLKPLSDRSHASETKLSELAIVCANCHAMVHRKGACRPLKGLISLKQV